VALFDWLRKNKKEAQKVQITKRRQSVLQNTAVAAAFAEAGEHKTARSLVDEPAVKRQILVVGREDQFSEMLVEYALDMAKRLGVEVVALSVTAAPLALPAGRREEAIELFRTNSLKNVEVMQELAAKSKVPFSHMVEIGNPDRVVEKLHAKHPGLRYVLTEPDPEVAEKSKGKVNIPVFDLGSYHGSVTA